SSALAVIFGLLLVFAGIGSLTGFAQRMRFSGRRSALVGGALSGLLGGLVGNQGGIRAAALLGFDVEREAFVATATAVALIVDGARIPVYLATQGADLATHWPLIVVLSIGAVVGTFAGGWALRRLGGASAHASTGTRMLGSQRQFRLMIGPGPLGLGAARLTFAQLSASAGDAAIANDARTTDAVTSRRLIVTLPRVSISHDPTR